MIFQALSAAGFVGVGKSTGVTVDHVFAVPKPRPPRASAGAPPPVSTTTSSSPSKSTSAEPSAPQPVQPVSSSAEAGSSASLPPVHVESTKDAAAAPTDSSVQVLPLDEDESGPSILEQITAPLPADATLSTTNAVESVSSSSSSSVAPVATASQGSEPLSQGSSVSGKKSKKKGKSRKPSAKPKPIAIEMEVTVNSNAQATAQIAEQPVQDAVISTPTAIHPIAKRTRSSDEQNRPGHSEPSVNAAQAQTGEPSQAKETYGTPWWSWFTSLTEWPSGNSETSDQPQTKKRRTEPQPGPKWSWLTKAEHLVFPI